LALRLGPSKTGCSSEQLDNPKTMNNDKKQKLKIFIRN